MRIPSQFNDHSLYPASDRSQGGRSGSSKSSSPKQRWNQRGTESRIASYRRVFRMVVALLLVLAVMRQAGQARLYRVFFPDGVVQYQSPHQNELTQSAVLGSGSSGSDVQDRDNVSEHDSVTSAVDPPVFHEEDLIAAMEKVVDGATWRGPDHEAFDLMRQQADSLPGENLPDVSVLPLLQQPDQHRGKIFRVAGSIVRCDVIEDYYQLWIKLADGTSHPLVAIVNHVPDDVANFGVAQGDGPDVTVVGRFIKRLSYRSNQGADVAPVLIGRIDQISRQLVETTVSPVASTQAGFSFQAQAVIGLAVVLGLALGWFLMWRTRIDSQRGRQLRQAQQSNMIDLTDCFDAKLVDGGESKHDGT